MLDTLAGELKERVHVLPCNLSDMAEVEALVPAAEKAMGQLDILVANAGITRDNLFVQLRDEDWDDVIRVNLTATFHMARAATKLMMRKRFGRIIAITSVVGVTGNAGQVNYAASKAGLIGMMKSIGAEYARRNVTANCIAPGFIATPMTDALNDKQREGILTKVPAGRLGTPDDIAAAAVYLASNEAAYVTRADHPCQRRYGDDLNLIPLVFCQAGRLLDGGPGPCGQLPGSMVPNGNRLGENAIAGSPNPVYCRCGAGRRFPAISLDWRVTRERVVRTARIRNFSHREGLVSFCGRV